MDTIKEFYLERLEDESGISGTGIVARGVILPSGSCVLEWSTFHSSINIYKNINAVEEIHGHGGKTLVKLGPPPNAIQVKKAARSPRKKKATTQEG